MRGTLGEQGWLPRMWLWFESWPRCHVWVEFVVGPLLCSMRFFLRVLQFLPLLRNQHFQIPIRSGTHFSEFLRTPKCSVGKQITTNYKFTRHQNSVTRLLQVQTMIDLSTDKIFKSLFTFHLYDSAFSF